MVVGIPGESHETAHAGDLDNQAASGGGGGGVVLAHDAHGVQGQVGDTPEVGVDDGAGLGLVGLGEHRGLGVAREAVPGVIDEDVDAAEARVGQGCG